MQALTEAAESERGFILFCIRPFSKPLCRGGEIPEAIPTSWTDGKSINVLSFECLFNDLCLGCC